MAKAEWRGVVIAESEAYEVVEGNVYFPRASVRSAHIAPSANNSTRGWRVSTKWWWGSTTMRLSMIKWQRRCGAAPGVTGPKRRLIWGGRGLVPFLPWALGTKVHNGCRQSLDASPAGGRQNMLKWVVNR